MTTSLARHRGVASGPTSSRDEPLAIAVQVADLAIRRLHDAGLEAALGAEPARLGDVLRGVACQLEVAGHLLGSGQLRPFARLQPVVDQLHAITEHLTSLARHPSAQQHAADLLDAAHGAARAANALQHCVGLPDAGLPLSGAACQPAVSTAKKSRVQPRR